jgi:radical SAM protein with 4Fe4S-binding SPASM domain
VIDTIEDVIIPKLVNTDIRIFYPREKMEAFRTVQTKPYQHCNSLHLYGFLWPDGRLFPCVEWAGTDGYEIGDLSTQSAAEIMRSRGKQRVINGLSGSIHKKCTPICAYHEMNVYLDSLMKKEVKYEPSDRASLPPGVARKIGLEFV